MNEKLASVEIITDIQPIAGADQIELAHVLGFQAVVKKGQYQIGEKILFIQPDTVLPDTEWAKFYKAKSSRVKAIKLRNTWSQGIIEKLTTVELDGFADNFKIGEEVSRLLKIIKYEPPAPQDLNAIGNLPYGLGKTDEERIENLQESELPYGEKVIITLKIDGQSLSVFAKEDRDKGIWNTGITSRSLELKFDSINNYTRINSKYNIAEKLKDYCSKKYISLCIRGECYGKGIQSSSNNPHSQLPLDFAVFNLYNMDYLKYEPFDKCVEVCKELGIPVVPIIEEVVFTKDIIKKYSEDLEKINNNYFEGVVVKLKDGRSFKIINKKYDSLK